MDNSLLIGSHVSMSSPNYVLGSVEEALSYEANALMLYTGAPQNTKRISLEKMKIDEAQALLKENGIPFENVIVHAPYIINLANSIKPEVSEIAREFLEIEAHRTKAIGATYLVLHPGSYTTATLEEGLNQIISNLNQIQIPKEVCICLETMAGKGSEIGRTFEEIAYILEHVKHPDNYGVCLDTCHIHDAGYDVFHFDEVLEMFDHVIGLEKLHVVHLNDSKNEKGSNKDRHANVGEGIIGFETLCSIAYHPKLTHIVKILETPYINGKSPYKEEIQMLRKKKYKKII
ncbi:MAG: deoxyribonuclease IV [Solobacterium sp.]|nr:deoxyribonuclease IV [Solobacterium sp.]